MAHPTAVGYRPSDTVPAPVYRAAARRVTRVLVVFALVMLALGVLEAATTGSLVPLQLAAASVLVATVPGTLVATEAVARLSIDGTLRRMDRELRDAARQRRLTPPSAG